MRTRRGSQQSCRSFVSASRIVTVLAAMPFLRMVVRTWVCAAMRMASYSSRCFPLSSTGL